MQADPRALSAEDVQFYRDNGYLIAGALGDAAEVSARQAYFEKLCAQMEAESPGRDEYSLLNYHSRCEGLWDLVHDPRLLDRVEALIGPDIVCWNTQYFDKRAGDERVISLHQDAPYWYYEPSTTVTAWVAIYPSTVENGCLHVVPGSHRLGALPWKVTDKPHPLAGTAEALSQEIIDAEAYGEPVPVELDAGQVSFHHDMLMHGSAANPSGHRRAGFAIRYSTPEARPTRDTWGKNALLCRGEDRYGHFSYVTERPIGDDTESWLVYLMRQRAMKRRNRE